MHRGVVVAAADDASVDASWDLASALYADPLLRPRKLDDGTARVLVGDPPRAGATPRQLELYELRRSFAPSSPSAGRLLVALSDELAASAVVVVWTDPPAQVHARLFVASSASFVDHELAPPPGPNLRVPWATTTAWLHDQATKSRPKQVVVRPGPAPAPSEQPGGGIVASGWFWGALVMAAGVGVLAYAVSSRDEAPSTIHLQGRVDR